jgi:hypothetical protein
MSNIQSIVACVLVSAFAAGGCAASVAAGSRPGDMTTQGHCGAAANERTLAAEHRLAAKNVPGNKASIEWRMRSDHLMAATQHERYAAQHEEAARFAGGESAPPCRTF